MAVWGATLASFITPSRLDRYFPESLDRLYRFENALFPGVAIAVGLGALAWRFGPRCRAALSRSRSPALLAVSIVIALVAMLLGDLATWTGREFVGVGEWTMRIRGFSRPALLLGVGCLLAFVGLGWRPGSGAQLSSSGRLRRGIALQGLAAVALCLPMVAAPASRFVPGLLGIRVPSRFFFFGLLAGALALGAAASFAARRLPIRTRGPAILGIGLFLLVPDLIPRSAEWHRVDRPQEFPAVYREMAARGLEGAVAELPFAREDLRADLVRMWHSTLGWNPTSAGYSGYEPRTAGLLREWESKETPTRLVVQLRSLGFRLLLLHEHEFPAEVREERSRDFLAAVVELGGEEVWSGEGDRLLALPRAGGR